MLSKMSSLHETHYVDFDQTSRWLRQTLTQTNCQSLLVIGGCPDSQQAQALIQEYPPEVQKEFKIILDNILLLDRPSFGSYFRHYTALVLYVYYDAPATAVNLDFFSRFGMDNPDCYYMLIINGGDCRVPISPSWNQVLRRPNQGVDFGGWFDALEHHKTHLDKFDRFIFLNDTVRGPFGDRDWVNTFSRLITDKVKLVGLSINGLDPWVNMYWSNWMLRRHFGRDDVAHVQSMFMVTDKIGLDILYPAVIDSRNLDKVDTIVAKEIGASMAIMDAGYKIGCIIPEISTNYHKYRDLWAGYNNYGLVRPEETIFFKTNRAAAMGAVELVEAATQRQNRLGCP